MQIDFYKIGASTRKLLKNEFVRSVPLVVIAVLFLVNQSIDSVIFLNLGIIASIVAISHFMRRLLFPYIDLEIYANKASESSIASAIVFLSVCILLSIILISSFNLIS